MRIAVFIPKPSFLCINLRSNNSRLGWDVFRISPGRNGLEKVADQNTPRQNPGQALFSQLLDFLCPTSQWVGISPCLRFLEMFGLVICRLTPEIENKRGVCVSVRALEFIFDCWTRFVDFFPHSFFFAFYYFFRRFSFLIHQAIEPFGGLVPAPKWRAWVKNKIPGSLAPHSEIRNCKPGTY